MGSLFKRGNVWWIKYSNSGKPIRESSKSKTKMVAKKLLERRESEITQGKMPGVLFEKVTFDELADEFIIDYQINERKSLDRAQLSVGHLRKEFGGVKVPDITTPRIQRYISDRMKWTCKTCNRKFQFSGEQRCPKCGEAKVQKGAAAATINRELAALRRLLNLGARQTPPKVDRVPYIPMLKENNIRKGFFEHGQFLALRNSLPEYLKPFVTFGYKIGWRDTEIASLTWGRNVDLDNGIVTLIVGETKNEDARTVYLDDELKTLLHDQRERQKRSNMISPYVFSNKSGTGPIVNFRRAWNQACREMGLGYGYRISLEYVQNWQEKLPQGPIFHDFRRTAVRNMIRSGIPERVAMMISGHKTRSVFDRYNIVNDADLKLAAERQQTYFESQVGTVSGTVHPLNEKRASA
jgi:integrase